MVVFWNFVNQIKGFKRYFFTKMTISLDSEGVEPFFLLIISNLKIAIFDWFMVRFKAYF